MVAGAILIASAFVWLVAIVLGLTIFAALLPLLLAGCAKRGQAAAASHKRPVLRYNYAVKNTIR